MSTLKLKEDDMTNPNIKTYPNPNKQDKKRNIKEDDMTNPNIKNTLLEKNLAAEPKSVIVVGDSLLHNIVGRGLQKDHKNSVKVRIHPGATTLDIIDHIRLEARKKPSKIIIMAGTNGIATENMDSMKNLKDALAIIKKVSPDTSVAMTSVPIRHDIKKW